MFFGLPAPTARQPTQEPTERQGQMTLVGSPHFTMSSPAIIPAGVLVSRGTGVMSTSQRLVSKAQCPLYLLNHARDGVRCGAQTVLRRHCQSTKRWSAR